MKKSWQNGWCGKTVCRAVIGLGLSLFSMQSKAYLPHVVGNGGHVVVCREDSGVIETVELLDIFELRYHSPRATLLDVQGLGLFPAAQKIIDALTVHSSSLRAQLDQRLRRFESEVHIADARLPRTRDDFSWSLPGENCRIEQVAVQFQQKASEQIRYQVDQELWAHMSDLHRAALVVHELLYSVAIDFSSEHVFDARPVRYLIGLAVTERVAQEFSPAQFTRFLVQEMKILCTAGGLPDDQRCPALEPVSVEQVMDHWWIGEELRLSPSLEVQVRLRFQNPTKVSLRQACHDPSSADGGGASTVLWRSVEYDAMMVRPWVWRFQARPARDSLHRPDCPLVFPPGLYRLRPFGEKILRISDQRLSRIR